MSALDNHPTPREQDQLVGHVDAERTLLDAARSSRLHHAWLLTGAAGIGKATLAFRFARWLLAGRDRRPADDSLFLDRHDPVFRRVASGSHADLITVARGYDEKRQRHRGEIVVEDVRPVGELLRRTAAEGGWRVVIIDGAEFLNRNAMNALLKLLEEPPPQTVLLLVCAAPGRLLPTIRSRCRTLRLAPLDDAAMQLVLRTRLPDQDTVERDALISLAHGSPGHALALASEGGLALDGLVRELIASGGASGSRAYQMADAVIRQEGGFATFLSLLGDAISVRVRDLARSSTDASGAPGDDIAIWQQIRRVQDETERFNLDKRQALLSSLNLLAGLSRNPALIDGGR